jgi:hypothetical protein
MHQQMGVSMRSDPNGQRFLVAFSKLKGLVENDPSHLEAEMQDGSPIVALCEEIYQLVRQFEKVERGSSTPFTEHVSNASIKARREYDELWRYYIWYAAHGGNTEFLMDEKIQARIKKQNNRVDELGILIDAAKFSAQMNSNYIHETIELVELINSKIPEFEEENESIDIGLSALGSLLSKIDLEDIFWKDDMLPHVLIPVHVSKRYGQAKQSLYRKLNDAGKAFIYGAPLAALTMQRAVLEEVLTKHWGAQNTTRGYQIRDANLSEITWDARADRLKRLGDKVLHGDPDEISSEQLDRLIIDGFLLLRTLIESAPESPQSHQERSA